MSDKVPTAYPVKIKAPHGARVMHVDWSDGHHSVYPHEILRGYCPCAECQGHTGDIQYRPGGNLEILELSPVGNYAIAITWGDKHSTGIYNFGYLRLLCRCPACQANLAGTTNPPLPRQQ